MSGSLAALLAAVVALQTPQASLVGVVRDGATGEALRGVEVVLEDLDRGVLTDVRGRYEVRDVPAGPQHLTVRRLGYEARTVHALVPGGGALEIDFVLRVDPVELPAIDVLSGTQALTADAGQESEAADRSVSQAVIRMHPMLSEPDGFRALTGGGVVMDPESPQGVHIRGGRSDQTGYLLDGVPVFSPYHVAGIFSSWNPDALAEVAVYSSMPSPALPDVLSGTVVGKTRRPGGEVRGQGALSTTQGRMTVDGPIGDGGYLFGFRKGLPDLFAPAGEPEYLRGETGDHLAKVELGAGGGRLEILSYGSESELGTASSAQGTTPESNQFEWRSHSLGVSWSRAVGSVRVQAQGWRAWTDAGSRWGGVEERTGVATMREDHGATFALERSSPDRAGGSRDRQELGIRFERSRSSYRVGPGLHDGPVAGLSTLTPVATVYASRSRDLGRSVFLEAGSTLSFVAGERVVGPRARVRWLPVDGLEVSGSYARSHQFSQSLRNEESLAGFVFPADLFVGAGGESVPVARGDLGVARIEWSGSAGLRLGLQAFTRRMHGLLFAGASETGPFSEGAFRVGRGSADGISAEAALSAARFGLMASYGYQSVQMHGSAPDPYAPSYATEHLLDAGISFFPTITSLVRLSASAGIGRRTSTSGGAFEWEACNLLDRGCEFLGTPHLIGGPGNHRLPHYLRLDLGVRKHWHLSVAGRDATIAMFGTLTNLLGRSNLLTEVIDPVTQERHRIDMRPRSPLVVGIDWRF